MTRQITGTICRIDGTPWAGAKLSFELKTRPAAKPGKLYPVMLREVYTGDDGLLPASLILDTPESGAWLYELRIEKNPPIQFYLEQGDGSAVPIDGLAFLAGYAGSEAGTPQGEFLLGLYEAVAGAADGRLLETAGGGLALTDAPGGYFMQRTAVADGESVTIPADHQMIVYGDFTAVGDLIAIGDLVIL